RLAADFPDEPLYQSQLAGALSNYAKIHLLERRAQDALPLVERAVTLQREAVRQLPQRKEAKVFLATHYTVLTHCMQMLKRIPDAAGACKEGIAVVETLAAEFPDDPELRRVLAGSYANLGRLS